MLGLVDFMNQKILKFFWCKKQTRPHVLSNIMENIASLGLQHIEKEINNLWLNSDLFLCLERVKVKQNSVRINEDMALFVSGNSTYV